MQDAPGGGTYGYLPTVGSAGRVQEVGPTVTFSLLVLWVVFRAHQEVIEQKGRQTDVLRRKQKEFRAGIIDQIDEKQEARIQDRRERYQEGVKLEEQAKMRRQRLEEAKIRKLNELRSVCGSGQPVG